MVLTGDNYRSAKQGFMLVGARKDHELGHILTVAVKDTGNHSLGSFSIANLQTPRVVIVPRFHI